MAATVGIGVLLVVAVSVVTALGTEAVSSVVMAHQHECSGVLRVCQPTVLDGGGRRDEWPWGRWLGFFLWLMISCFAGTRWMLYYRERFLLLVVEPQRQFQSTRVSLYFGLKGFSMQSIQRAPSSATLPPAVIEFLKRPLAAQIATVNPNRSPQQTIMWFKRVQSIDAFCQRVQAGVANATFAQKRTLVELLIDRVLVANSDGEIRYAIPTHPRSEPTRFCHVRKDYFRHIIEIADLPNGNGRPMLLIVAPDGRGIRLAPIDRDRLRHAVAANGLGEETRGGLGVPPGHQRAVNRLARFVHRPIQGGP